MIRIINNVATKILRPWRIESVNGGVIIAPFDDFNYLSCDIIKRQLTEQDIQIFYDETAVVEGEEWTRDFFDIVIFDENNVMIDNLEIDDDDIETFTLEEIAEFLFDIIRELQEDNEEESEV